MLSKTPLTNLSASASADAPSHHSVREKEANVLSSDKLMPFVVLTGVQDVLYWVAFYLSIKSGGKAKKK